jgi:hypothetical protein
VVIHEVLSHDAVPYEDAVELYNPGERPMDISGWYLSDSRADEENLKKHRIRAGTVLAPGAFTVIYAFDFSDPLSTGTGQSFELPPGGGAVYLASADAAGNLTGHITGVTVPAVGRNLPVGWYATSTGIDFPPLEYPTFGAEEPATVWEFRGGTGMANGPPGIGPVVINEIHYHPAPGSFEFLELHNLGPERQLLFDAALGRGWELDGILNAEETEPFEFPPGTEMAPGSYLLLVSVDPAFFRSVFSLPASVPILGPFGGALDSAGESIELRRPESLEGGEVLQVRIDRVRYNDKAPWPGSPDGGGPSLERILPYEYGNDAANWSASSAGGGTPGARNSATSPAANSSPAARFRFQVEASASAAVSFDASPSRDLDGHIVSYRWNFGDGRQGTGVTTLHTFEEPGEYAVELTVRDDDGASATAMRVVSILPGLIAGDANLDGNLNLGDVLNVLNLIFHSGTLPCSSPEASLVLLDANGDRWLDVSDALFTLFYLFKPGSSPPVLGTECITIPGCPRVCNPP